MVRGFAVLLTLTGLAMGQAMVQHAAAAAGGAAAAAGSKKVADGLEKILGGAANAAADAAGTTPTPKKQVVAGPPAPTTAARKGKHSPFEPQVTRDGGSEFAPTVGSARSGIPSPSEVEASASGEAAPANPWVSRGKARPQQAAVPAFVPFVSTDVPVPAVARGSRRNSAGAPAVSEAAVVMPKPADPAVPMLIATPITAMPVVPPPPVVAMATAEKLAAIKKGATYEEIVASIGKPAAKIEMIEDGKVFESLRIEARGNKLGTIRLVDGVVTSVEPVAR